MPETLAALRGGSVLVTGGAGFVGSHLVDRLLALGSTVTVLDDLSHGSIENVDPRAHLFTCDVRDRPTLTEVVRGTDVVFHLAADTRTWETEMGWADPFHDLDVNGMGTLCVLESVRSEAPHAIVVVASSAAVYGPTKYTPVDESHPTNPVSPYGVSKLASERYAHAFARSHGLRAISARIFNSYGPRQRRYVMYDLARKLLADPTRLTVIGSGEQVRDYTYVTDTVDALVSLVGLAESDAGGVFNIASGMPVRVIDLAHALAEAIAPGAEIITTGTSWTGDIDVILGDPRALRERTDAAPRIDLTTGLASLIQWLREDK